MTELEKQLETYKDGSNIPYGENFFSDLIGVLESIEEKLSYIAKNTRT